VASCQFTANADRMNLRSYLLVVRVAKFGYATMPLPRNLSHLTA
jgi:hypothetical protein